MKIHPALFLPLGVILLLVGNRIDNFLGVALALFGDFLILYSLYLGIKWLTKKPTKKEQAPPPPKPQV